MNPDVFARHLDDAYRRIRVLETHMLGKAGATAPPVVTSTIIVDVRAGANYYPAGTWTLQSGIFTITGTGATVVIEGAVDGQMYAWNNYVGPPRRECWVDIVGFYASNHSEWPFGFTRVTYSWRSGSLSIPAGTYTARLMAIMAATNQMRVYGGYLRVTKTQ
jgi:hypothetical protein